MCPQSEVTRRAGRLAANRSPERSVHSTHLQYRVLFGFAPVALQNQTRSLEALVVAGRRDEADSLVVAAPPPARRHLSANLIGSDIDTRTLLNSSQRSAFTRDAISHVASNQSLNQQQEGSAKLITSSCPPALARNRGVARAPPRSTPLCT